MHNHINLFFSTYTCAFCMLKVTIFVSCQTLNSLKGLWICK